MNRIKKYQLIQFLKEFENKNCKTIKDIIELIDKDLKNDDDIVFQWKEYK